MSKPSYGTPLDPDHPLSAGLILAMKDVAGDRLLDDCGGTWSVEDGTLSESTLSGEAALSFPGTGAHMLNEDLSFPDDGATIALYGLFSPGQGSAFGNAFGGSSARCQAHLPYDGTIYWDFGGASSGSTRLSWTPPGGWFGDPHLVIFSAGPDGLSIWSDGEEVASNSSPSGRSGSAGFRLGKFDVYANQMLVAAAWAWDRQLGDSEKADFSAAPYAMYSGGAGGDEAGPPCGVFASGGACIVVAG